MSADYYEELAYDMARAERFLQPHEDDEEEEMSRVYLGPPRRTPVTEDWLVAQDNLRRAALRDTRWAQFKHTCEVLLVYAVLLGVSLSLLAGLFYAGKRLWELL